MTKGTYPNLSPRQTGNGLPILVNVDRKAGNELAARLRAAMNYAKGTTLADVAAATGLSRSTVATWSSQEYVPVNRLGHFDRIAELCGLPAAFFTADLSRIGDLPPDPRFQESATARATAPADLMPPFPSRRRATGETGSEAG
jgi:transcriptional regulator with XRE-family HTH domain